MRDEWFSRCRQDTTRPWETAEMPACASEQASSDEASFLGSGSPQGNRIAGEQLAELSGWCRTTARTTCSRVGRHQIDNVDRQIMPREVDA